MARKLDKQKAIKLRQKGNSYSQIKEKLGINKSTLSGWLSDMPLSQERIKKLRDFNPQRIERYRNTMQNKRNFQHDLIYKNIKDKLKSLSDRDLLISGFFLYWGEGSKTKYYSVALTNTNPKMLVFFIKWLDFFNVPKEKLRVKLHLYSDMKVKEQISFWSKTLNIPISQFRNSYIKESKFSSISYKNGFGHGTCSVIVEDKAIASQILIGLEYIQDILSSN
jgi:hypothetical protein